MERKNYETLNAMRGVAAVSVVLYHASNLLGVQIFPRGYLAVDLFFVLSGFVIGHAYDNRIAGGLDWLEFAKIRVIRFYPLYLAGILFGIVRELALIATHNQYALTTAQLFLSIVTALLFLPFPISARNYSLFSMNIPSWSLMYELLVNIAYAAFFRKLGNRTLLLLAIIAGVALSISVAISGSANLGGLATDAPEGISRTIFSFSYGLLIYRMNLRSPMIPGPLLLVAVAFSFVVPEYIGYYYDLMFIIALSPALVIVGASTEPSPLALKPFVYLGVISFPIYAIHRPLLELAAAAASLSHLPGPIVGAACIVGLLIICPFLDRWYDRPFRAAISNAARTKLRNDPGRAAAP
jgi:peptidoglycan/LPS O-acetylase OafA/YrhL